MPNLWSLIRVVTGLGAIAFCVLLLSEKLRAQRRSSGAPPDRQQSLMRRLIVGLLLALAMAGGAIAGIFVGIGLALVAGGEDAGDHPVAVFLFWAPVVCGFLAPALCYWQLSRKLARSGNESIDDNEWFNEKGSM